MARRQRALLETIMSCAILVLALGACSTGSTPGPTPPPESTPTIESVLNATSPGVSVRSGDWTMIAGSSFGAAQDGGSVTFLLENIPLPAASYYLWSDDAIYCQIPVWLTEDGGVVGEDLTVTVTTGVGLVSNAVVIPMDETPNPAPAPTPPLIKKRPYVIYENDKTQMKVAWQTIATPGSAVIQWGPTPDCAQGQSEVAETGSGAGEHQFFYSIADLTPDALLYYKVVIDGAESYTGSFRTAPPDDATTLTFYGYGDTRDGPDHMDAVLSHLLDDVGQDPAKRQTFCLHDGDFVHRGLTEVYWDSQYFDPEYPATIEFLSTMPVIASLGNHECYKQGDADVPKADYGKLFKKYFPYPMYSTDDFYYSFDYGPLHVATVDPYKADITPGSAQLAWLDDDLARSMKPWKIVMVHPPFYSGNGPDNIVTKLRENIEPILQHHHIKLVVQGHQHYYSRSEKDGITYLVLGGGGGPLIKPDSSEPYYVFGKSCYHFARFEISGGEMNIRIVDDRGDLVEQVPTIHN
jgi:hypothetical protein